MSDIKYTTAPLSPDMEAAVAMFDMDLLEGSDHKEDKALLTLIRAVRAPRLSGEQKEAVKECIRSSRPEARSKLRAAFAGELGEVEG